ncbi:MAG: hypothetical protein WD598_12400 [Acidimicrobiia bacterium]
MSTVLLVGAGAVGARAGRQLVDTSGIDQVFVADREPERSEAVAELLGPTASVVVWPPAGIAEVDAVAVALPGAAALSVARAAVSARRPVAAVSDEEVAIAALLALDAPARDAGVAVIAGCALVPGLSEVLARHAANDLDAADEVHVARAGAAGPECVAALRRIRRVRALEWRDDTWRSERRLGPQLVWFPDPVGARECDVAPSGVALMRDAVPGARHASVRVAEPPVRNTLMALLGRRPLDNGWGAARVEVWGWRGEARESIVYGVIERPAVAAGTVLAVTAARLAGALPTITFAAEPIGAGGLGTFVTPAPFLAELARRGVKAAAFEGAAAA